MQNSIYFCPDCDYAIDKHSIDMLRFNYQCPRCTQFYLSEFKSKKEKEMKDEEVIDSLGSAVLRADIEGFYFNEKADLEGYYFNEKLEMNIWLSDDNSSMPKYAKEGDSCADLYANTFLTEGKQTIIVEPWERVLVKTGVHIGLPEGMEAQVRPRSGLAYKKGIHVHLGTIDNGYRGDVGVLLFNLSNDPFIINNGDRIAQLAVVPIDQVTMNQVDKEEELGETERGLGGFGHSGV